MIPGSLDQRVQRKTLGLDNPTVDTETGVFENSVGLIFIRPYDRTVLNKTPPFCDSVTCDLEAVSFTFCLRSGDQVPSVCQSKILVRIDRIIVTEAVHQNY